MTLLELITAVNYNLRGTDDEAPNLGDDDWIYWTTIANQIKNNLYDDSSKNWGSAYEEREIGGIAADTDPQFDLEDDFINPASEAYIIDTSGSYHYFDIIKPNERDRSAREFFIAGFDPQILYCSNEIKTGETIIDGTLYLAAYWRPEDMDATNEEAFVPVDDPNWLAMATAAAIAFNDITYEEKSTDLSGQAAVLYKQMSRKNRKGTRRNPRVTPTKVNRIRGPR